MLAVCKKPSGRERRVAVNVVDAAVRARDHQLGLHLVLNAKHNAIARAHRNRGAGIFDCLGCVFNLEDAAVGRVRARGQVVPRALARHGVHTRRCAISLEFGRACPLPMTSQLPPPLLRFFTPRPPLEYARPLPHDIDPNAPPRRRTQADIERGRVRPLTGIAEFLERARDDIEAPPKEPLTHAVVTLVEMHREQREQQRADTRSRMERECACLLTDNPKMDTHAAGDPFKTLFLSRLVRHSLTKPYATTEHDLQKEFGRYGPIERIHLVRDLAGKSRGYAFILYERERDMRTAYSRAEGVRIDGRRIMVDVERGRTVRDWRPARLGGGLGGLSRKPKRPVEPRSFRGGRGGGRGGFRGGRGGGAGRGRPRDSGFGPRREPRYRDRDAGGGFGGYNRPPPFAADDRMAKRPRI